MLEHRGGLIQRVANVTLNPHAGLKPGTSDSKKPQPPLPELKESVLFANAVAVC